jgi:hypothetical protein
VTSTVNRPRAQILDDGAQQKLRSLIWDLYFVLRFSVQNQSLGNQLHIRILLRQPYILGPLRQATLIIWIRISGKGKVQPRQATKDQTVSTGITLSLTSTLDGVRGQRHAPVA